MLAFRVFGLAGTFAMAGCRLSAPDPVVPAPRPQRTPYPEDPAPDDPLAADPCSVKKTPDIAFRDVSDLKLLVPLSQNLEFLENANPVFLCGLERVELLGDDAYLKSAAPEYTRRSVGIYTPGDRVIHLKASAGITLTHEVGHHIHNLGYFAPTVREFLAQSWEVDPISGGRKPRCSGPDCFVNDAAGSKTTEDWARTFEQVLLRPIETGVATNFSLTGPTPLQKKVELIRSIATLPEPVKAVVRFGEARVLDETEAAAVKKAASSLEMPASLPKETIRRIFVAGKTSLPPSVWDNRQRPFLSGDYVVFPVFQAEKKKMGFFAYDLKKEWLRPMTLDLEDVPEEIRDLAGTFTSLQVYSDDQGALHLAGYLENGSAISVPLAVTL